MKASVSTLLALAAAVPSVVAHYNFNALIVNGQVTKEWEYVRKNTNSNSPVTDVTSKDFVCNVGGLESGSSTKTHEVAPGDEVGFTAFTDISHPGPLQVYLSPAKGDAASYDGSGDWVKVYGLSTSEINAQGLKWASDGLKNFTFPLPKETPAGEYLLRVEHIALHSASSKGGAQFYISCAQIKVTGSGSGSLSPAVKIPGVYDGTEPGIMINIYYPVPTTYTMPGPALWPSGQTSDGSGSGSGSSNTTSPAATAAASASSGLGSPAPTGGSNGTSAPTTLQTVASPTASVPLSTGSAGGAVAQWGQCGGASYNGPTQCASGFTCKVQNDYYSQCL